MPFRNYSYTRRSPVNPKAVGGTATDDDIDNRKYCPRCQFTLSYFEERDLFFCGKCAYNFPDELLAKNREQEEEQSQVNKGAATAADDIKEEDIHVVSLGKRTNPLRKDPFAYLKKDDAYLEKSGLVMVKDEIIFADDGKTTTSEELQKQNRRLRNKTIR